MEDVIRIAGLGLISLILIIVIKQYRPEFAIYISLIARCFYFACGFGQDYGDYFSFKKY